MSDFHLQINSHPFTCNKFNPRLYAKDIVIFLFPLFFAQRDDTFNRIWDGNAFYKVRARFIDRRFQSRIGSNANYR